MRVLGVASVLVTLVFCKAENVPRWSKPDERNEGEWVPLKSERIREQPARIPSAISPSRHNYERAFPHQISANQFTEFPKQQMIASQTAPQRVAFVNPQSIEQQSILQPQLQQPIQIQPQLQTPLDPQLQLDSQQLLTQFLNQQIQQASLPIFNRALLQKQSIPNPHYYSQPNQFNIVPMYNQGPLLLSKGEYTASGEKELEGKVTSEDAGGEENSYDKPQKTNYVSQPFSSNFSSPDNSNQKEEVQILYVPIEMLKQQEQKARNKSVRKEEKNSAGQEDSYNTDIHHERLEIPQKNQKDSRKFRHPIQPLKEQVPAYHLTEEGSTYQNAGTLNEKTKEEIPDQDYHYKRGSQLGRGSQPGREYQKYDHRSGSKVDAVSRTPSNKEQNVDESTIRDEISDYRHAEQDKNRNNINKAEPSLPQPNQPPLSVFMEKTSSNRVGDLVSLLRGLKTIPVLDSIGPESPQVFVGPSNLHTPSGYLKYELPYLSSLDNQQTGNQLSNVPFFVAPLNFQPPPGFAKIPFPPPHIGSVVLSNVTQQVSLNEQLSNIQSNPDLVSSKRYKESFTIPADISSISPQLPSLINSLQEEEYSLLTSTEAISTSTEIPAVKERPTGFRRFNSRGSQRGSATYTSTTRKPVSRQRRPLNRVSNYRTNHHSEEKTTPEKIEDHYDPRTNYYQDQTNKEVSYSTEKVSADPNLKEIPQYVNDDRYHSGLQYTSNIENVKSGETSKENNHPSFINQGTHDISNEEATIPHPSLNSDFYATANVNKNGAYFNTPKHHNTQTSLENDEYHTTHVKDNVTPIYQQFSPVNNIKKDEEAIIYKQGSNVDYTEPSTFTRDYEDTNYRKRGRDNVSKPAAITEENYEYRENAYRTEPTPLSQNDYLRGTVHKETPTHIDSYVLEKEQHQQPIGDIKPQEFYNSYLSQNEPQTTTPFIHSYESHSQESLEPYKDTLVQDKPTEDVQKELSYHDNIHKTKEDFNVRTHYDTNTEERKLTTEKTYPARTRSRGRGRPYNQHKQTTISSLNANEQSDEGTNYKTSNDRTPSSGRKYPYERAHRRPLKPTVSTTTTTTTNAPPGTKYLIRTRRPSVPQTKLHTGRGRIRRPTTPTTTVPTTTTEQLHTLPILWQQTPGLTQGIDDYRLKEGTKQVQYSGLDSVEYGEDTLPYRVHEKATYGSQNEKNHDHDQTIRKLTEAETPGVPKYSFNANDDKYSIQKHFRTSTQPYYTDEYETTSKPHFSRNQGTGRKQQHFIDYEVTQIPQYSKDYETTQKSYYGRDFETTQKSVYPTKYETTQKQHFPEAYETTPKTQFFRNYQTEKPQYSVDYETTPKQQIREHEPTQNPQYFREYEGSQKYSSRDSNVSPKLYSENDSTKTVLPSSDYETTEKPNTFQDNSYYDTGRKTVNYQDYETTPRNYVPAIDSREKQVYTHGSRQTSRTSNYRRRPSTGATRYDSSKQYKSNPVDEPVKNSDADWNQAVTIQQSHSYVFNPDETFPEESKTKPLTDSKFESSQNDYDDYFNPQGSEQYSSDQSPFPSNEQRITYTQIKAIDLPGKASQYPKKDNILLTEDKTQEEKISSPDNLNIKNDDTKDSFDSKELMPEIQYDINPSSPMESKENQSKPVQGNRKRGTWVRRRIKKPKDDLFEIAESQRFSAVRKNLLTTDLKFKDQSKNFTKEKTGKDYEENQKHVEISSTNSSDEGFVKLDIEPTISEPPEQKEQENGIASNTTNDLYMGKETTTETGTEKYYTNQTPSLTTITADNENTDATSEPYRTSTTTEISLETEICYKGQCIKTKRRKEDGNIF